MNAAMSFDRRSNPERHLKQQRFTGSNNCRPFDLYVSYENSDPALSQKCLCRRFLQTFPR